MRSFLAAFAFYTILPLPAGLGLNFDRVARWAPFVGLAIGGLLAGLDWGLGWIVPPAVRAALVLCLWVGLSAGLHLDGAMDTADGLAVSDRDGTALDRRLAVMADSYTGAFGVMVAAILLLLKFAAIQHLPEPRWVWLLLAPAWGRWGQVMAIARYPYLKPQGKGKFLKDTLQIPLDLLPGTALLAIAAISIWFLVPSPLAFEVWMLGSGVIALGVGTWFARQLGGHTGDTYGAVVEWTEAIANVTATLLLT